MKYLADHCVSMRTVNYLRKNNFSITTLKNIKKHHLPDDEVLALAIRRGEILITEDQGFANILEYPLYTHEGIIVIITKTKFRQALHASLKQFLSSTSQKQIKGKLIRIEDHVVRIKK